MTRSHSNLHTVRAGGETYACRPRGRLRRQRERVLVGDEVRITVTGPGEGVIEAILPRRNRLERPPVANVDQAVIIFSAREPASSLVTADRMLVEAMHADLGILFCLNKIDLLEPGEVDPYLAPYRAAGLKTCTTSAVAGLGLDCLRRELTDLCSVFAGESGVGKSSLLNALSPGLALRTGELGSWRRGRHTTRHVELLAVAPGGLVADTPGLSLVALPAMAPPDLSAYWPELAALAPGCRFSGCLHRDEPDCGVKAAVAAGELDRGRYQRYLSLLEEVEQAYRRY